ncbi:MAG: hypothetical protein RBS37_06700 [Bacteroidales bacterium]|nr:hypothetical protein [Bacteroidales bacterium]
MTIASIHNLTFYQWLTATAREKIAGGNFTSWKQEMAERLRGRL